MTAFSIHSPETRGLLYGLITLASMVVFGNVAEICDVLNTCPARLAVIIAFAVFATIISGVMLAAVLFDLEPLLKLEFLFCVALFVTYSVCVGIISSVRTRVGGIISVSFAWFAEVMSFIVLFASLTAEGGLLDIDFRTSGKLPDVERGGINSDPATENIPSGSEEPSREEETNK